MDTISLSRTVFEIFDFKVFRVWPWPLTPKGHLGSKKIISFESSYMTSYLTSMNTTPLSRTVFEIFDFEVFRVWPWPLTTKGHLGSKKLYYSKAHVWQTIWPLLTPSLYLVPFSRYSTSEFLGFDLDLWPRKVIWIWKKIHYSKAHIWLPIWHPLTQSLYLVPFSRYSTSKFSGFDIDLRPQKTIWGHKKYNHSRAHIELTIWPPWTSSLYLVPFTRYSTSKFSGFDLDLWPQKVIWGPKKLNYSRAHIWHTIWPLWTPSLYLVPFSRYSTSKFLGFDLDLWPQKVIWGPKNLYDSKAYIWLTIWPQWTQSLYLVPFSRYSTPMFSKFDLDLWPQKVICSRRKSYNSKVHLRLPIWLLWTTSL